MLSIFGNKSKSVSAPSAPASSLTSSSAAERQAALSHALADASETRRLGLEAADAARRAVHDEHDRAERAARAQAADARAQVAERLADDVARDLGPLTDALRTGGRPESEALRVAFVGLDARCREQLGEPLRPRMIIYVFARKSPRESIEDCGLGSPLGLNASRLGDALGQPVAFHAEVERMVLAAEQAAPAFDVEIFHDLARCCTESDAARVIAAAARLRQGLAA